MTFSDRVLERLSRATDREKEAVRRELEAHMEDHREALVEAGMDPEAAREKAEAAMGDPEEVGKALNAQFSTFWLWAKRAVQGVVAFLVILLLVFSERAGGCNILKGPWEVLSGAWENWRVRQEERVEPDTGYEPDFPSYTWRGWETMRVGDDIVCLFQADLLNFFEEDDVDHYDVCFYFCTYNKDIFTPPNGEIWGQLTATCESMERVSGWWTSSKGTGVAMATYGGFVKEGDTYLDVTYDRYGTYATMRCPIHWEEVEP